MPSPASLAWPGCSGPTDLPTERARGLVLAESGNAARLVVVFDSDPLAGEAIDNVRLLQERMPELASESGLSQARVSMTGQTLIAAEVAQLTRESLEITLVVALADRAAHPHASTCGRWSRRSPCWPAVC